MAMKGVFVVVEGSTSFSTIETPTRQLQEPKPLLLSVDFLRSLDPGSHTSPVPGRSVSNPTWISFREPHTLSHLCIASCRLGAAGPGHALARRILFATARTPRPCRQSRVAGGTDCVPIGASAEACWPRRAFPPWGIGRGRSG